MRVVAPGQFGQGPDRVQPGGGRGAWDRLAPMDADGDGQLDTALDTDANGVINRADDANGDGVLNDAPLDRPVALKVPRPESWPDRRTREPSSSNDANASDSAVAQSRFSPAEIAFARASMTRFRVR